MKQIACWLALASLTLAQSATALPPQSTAPDQAANLIALERMWNQAQVSRDAKAVASMIGDRFVNTEYDGEVSNRGKFLADFADPQFKPSLMNIDDVKVDLYDKAAIVTGSYHVKVSMAASPTSTTDASPIPGSKKAVSGSVWRATPASSKSKDTRAE